MLMEERNEKTVAWPLVGIEAEFHLIDMQGNITNRADQLLLPLREKYPKIGYQQEVALNMLEIANYPHMSIPNTIENIIDAIHAALEIGKDQDVMLYPFGTYPGAFEPQFRPKLYYKILQRVLGDDRFPITGRCVGYHSHFSLPPEIYDPETRELRLVGDRKIEEKIVNIYNMAVAFDPILEALMQSSPFYQGRFLGNDSRVIVDYGDPQFDYPQGLFTNHQEFGGHLSFANNYSDLYFSIKNQQKTWSDLAHNVLEKNESIPPIHMLKCQWNPHRINSIGTIEFRCMDTNLPSLLAAATQLTRTTFETLQNRELKVIPGETGDEHPFILKENRLYVPSLEKINNVLIPRGAYEGLKNDCVYENIKEFFAFLKPFIKERERPLLKPFYQMLKKRRTVADEIMETAKKVGYRTGKELTNDQVRRLALYGAKRLRQDIDQTRKILHMK
ncbi:MAG: hypothetical protein KKA90_01935 [Nanoarchaeota archaeon]|nr:hypothetical protein [Nanoarchaeota archaeon]